MYYLHHHQHTPSIPMCIMRDGHIAVVLSMTKTMKLTDIHCLFVTMELKSMAVRFFGRTTLIWDSTPEIWKISMQIIGKIIGIKRSFSMSTLFIIQITMTVMGRIYVDVERIILL